MTSPNRPQPRLRPFLRPLRPLAAASVLAAALVLTGALAAAPGPASAEASAASARTARAASGPIDGLAAAGPDTVLDPRIGPGTYLAVSKAGADRSPLWPLTPIQVGPLDLNGCTANWLWKDDAATPNLYLGTAGHCLVPPGFTTTEGPGGYDASGVRVYACHGACPLGGFAALGQALVAPTGWVELGEVAFAVRPLTNTDFAPDFGLVRLSSGLLPLLDPALKGWGGPEGSSAIASGDLAFMHGNGGGLAETAATKNRAGVFLSSLDGLWTANLPIAGGDSGSAVGLAADLSSPVLAAGIATHAMCDVTDVYGSPMHAQPLVCVSPQPASTVAGGTTVAKAIALAGAAGLCIQVVEAGEDLANLGAAAC